ncbi:MAG: hypothetical protein HYT37_03220 [Candidatus Sungbacteria bacterium]|nr:hypothetical protein [Candidatus Sungbacteria bacterium]
MGTVRDFKKMVEEELPPYHEWMEEQLEFFQKLNKIGARNIDKFPPEKYPDIDATVELSDEEWSLLEREFETVKSSVQKTPAILGFRKQ